MSKFDFQRFRIEQDCCAMKVGTDGVLLGAWFNISAAKTVLDIGTGTGLIALMAAQRNETATIFGVEIDENAATQAAENVRNSPFASQISIISQDINDFATTCAAKFEAIVCNPPYFVHSLKCPDSARTVARHNDSLSFPNLLKISKKLLASNGKLSVILPTSEAEIFKTIATENRFFLTRLTHVFGTTGGKEIRQLLEFSKKPTTCDEQSLAINLAPNRYTPEFRELTKHFYLNAD